MNEFVDVSFFKDEEQIRKIGKLQEIIYYLDDENFDESVEAIIGMGLTSDIMAADLARNIIRLSIFYKSKIPLLVRLVSELKSKSNIITQISIHIDFGINFEAQPFLLALVEAGLIDSSYEPKLRINDKEFIQRIIEEDNVEEFQQVFASPDFDMNQVKEFKVTPLINIGREYLSYVELAALYGSINCFRFLYINGAVLKRNKRRGISIIQLAIAGGNIDIIEILKQSKIDPEKSCVTQAILFHRIEIFDWLMDQYSKMNFDQLPVLCIRNEFIHGLKMINRMKYSILFEASCESGLSSITKLVLTNFSHRAELGLIKACQYGNYEIVKLLLSIPSIDINKEIVFISLKRSLCYYQFNSALCCMF